MNVIDILVSLFFLVMFYFGFKKGVVRQLNNQTSVYIALVASFYCVKIGANFVEINWSIPRFLSIPLSFILLFVCVILLLFLFTLLIEKTIKFLKLNFLNQMLGGFFSFFKYVFYLLIPFILVYFINKKINFYTADNSFWYKTYVFLSQSFLDYF
jgi:membrane protein required for colicin V production